MNDKREQLERLKQHFGRRVYEQARSIVNSWNVLHQVHWNSVWFREFYSLTEKLNKLSERYQFESFFSASESVLEVLHTINPDKAPESSVLEYLNEQISLLAHACSRVNDDVPVEQISSGRKPVYLCLTDPLQASVLQEQLSFFGVPTYCYEHLEELQQSIHYRIPAAIIADTLFNADGIQTVNTLQNGLRQAIPAIFYSRQPPTIEQRLAAVRANGKAFYEVQFDLGPLVELLMSIYALRSEPPFRVLVVDDSQAQSLYAEKTLNQAGIFTRAVNDPLLVIDVIDKFQPDAILMDMYMPGCTGPELAQVIRQQGRYDVIPILYLSAESDVAKQLEAVGLGGDDFLTKPVQKDVLISTVVNRCKRHRGLRDQMTKDSLTGLVDHNTVLESLRRQIEETRKQNQPVSFVMIDLDKFKSVNDSYGHPMGDRVIRALALYLRQRFRVTDIIGRYGGEEFAMVMPNTDAATAARLMDEVRAGFEQLVHQDERHQIRVTFSSGVAQALPEDDVSSLTHRADTALYDAKKSGRNRVMVSNA